MIELIAEQYRNGRISTEDALLQASDHYHSDEPLKSILMIAASRTPKNEVQALKKEIEDMQMRHENVVEKLNEALREADRDL